jgi:hypothetical protein
VSDTSEVSDTADEPAGPVIHVPDRELSDEDEPEASAAAKKRTRRGSRGGRNRRKKTATAGTATVEAEAPVAGAEELSANGDWGYTPMSEWGLDDAERP